MHKTHMKTILRRNGHLQIEGDETTEELRQALLFLHSHTQIKCAYQGTGTPIEALLPDISVLAVKSTRTPNVKNAVIKRARV